MQLFAAGVFTGEEAGESMLSPALIQPNIFPAVFLPAGKMASKNGLIE